MKIFSYSAVSDAVITDRQTDRQTDTDRQSDRHPQDNYGVENSNDNRPAVYSPVGYSSIRTA